MCMASLEARHCAGSWELQLWQAFGGMCGRVRAHCRPRAARRRRPRAAGPARPSAAFPAAPCAAAAPSSGLSSPHPMCPKMRPEFLLFEGQQAGNCLLQQGCSISHGKPGMAWLSSRIPPMQTRLPPPWQTLREGFGALCTGAAGKVEQTTCCDPLFSRRTRWLSTDQVPSGMLPMASPNSGNDASEALRAAPFGATRGPVAAQQRG